MMLDYCHDDAKRLAESLKRQLDDALYLMYYADDSIERSDGAEAEYYIECADRQLDEVEWYVDNLRELLGLYSKYVDEELGD